LGAEVRGVCRAVDRSGELARSDSFGDARCRVLRGTGSESDTAKEAIGSGTEIDIEGRAEGSGTVGRDKGREAARERGREGRLTKSLEEDDTGWMLIIGSCVGSDGSPDGISFFRGFRPFLAIAMVCPGGDTGGPGGTILIGVVPEGPAVSTARPRGENIFTGVVLRLAGADTGVAGRLRLGGEAGPEPSVLAELFLFLPRTFLGTPAMDTKLSWLGTAKVAPAV
jgi:hypothetical protein